MNIAILSDIHSNVYALRAVVNDFPLNQIEGIIILGDIFGYYPWANETYEILMKQNIIKSIRGNHDELMLEEVENEQHKTLSYYSIARQNRADLLTKNPDAIKWLINLKTKDTYNLEEQQLYLCHGTPDDSINGRYYPDNVNEYNWFPNKNELLLLGHTHYPIIRQIQSKGTIFNPGSVGQPRDGNPMPSWGIYNTVTHQLELKRTAYNNLEAIVELEKINWNKRAILALNKINQGKLI